MIMCTFLYRKKREAALVHDQILDEEDEPEVMGDEGEGTDEGGDEAEEQDGDDEVVEEEEEAVVKEGVAEEVVDVVETEEEKREKEREKRQRIVQNAQGGKGLMSGQAPKSPLISGAARATAPGVKGASVLKGVVPALGGGVVAQGGAGGGARALGTGAQAAQPKEISRQLFDS